MSTPGTANTNTTESAFVKEQLKRAISKGAVRYPADYTPRDTALIKRKSLLPVPVQCLSTASSSSSTDANSHPNADTETVTLTLKTLTGQAHKLHVHLHSMTCQQLHAMVRSQCNVAPTSSMRILRQGRVVPDNESALTAFVVDATVPLNLIEKEQQPQSQGTGQPGKALSEAFWKDFDVVLGKHVADAGVKEKLRRGFRESFEQWLQ